MRRRKYRSPMARRPHHPPIAVAVAARPLPSVRWLLLLAWALLLALVLPRFAKAEPAPAKATLALGARGAVVQVQTPVDAEVLVAWGLAPNAARTLRSAAGTDHRIALQGLEPGRIYVYRVYVNGMPLTPPTPFRTAGETPVSAPLRI